VRASVSQMKKLRPWGDHAITSGSLPSISASLRGKVLPFPLLTLPPLLDCCCCCCCWWWWDGPPGCSVEDEAEAAEAAHEALRVRRVLRVMVVVVMAEAGGVGAAAAAAAKELLPGPGPLGKIGTGLGCFGGWSRPETRQRCRPCPTLGLGRARNGARVRVCVCACV
jgi:hypothetical protein